MAEPNTDDWQPTPFMRNVSHMVRELGLSTITVLFLLGQSAGWIPSGHTKIAEGVLQNGATLSYNQVKLNSIDKYSRKSSDSLKSICWLQAETDHQRRICRYGLGVVDAEEQFNRQQKGSPP